MGGEAKGPSGVVARLPFPLLLVRASPGATVQAVSHPVATGSSTMAKSGRKMVLLLADRQRIVNV